MCYKCYICTKNLNINDFLEIPSEDNFINNNNLQIYKEKYSYNQNINKIIIKNSDNFIFFYFIFCFKCFDNYLNYKLNCKYNILIKLKNRELGI